MSSYAPAAGERERHRLARKPDPLRQREKLCTGHLLLHHQDAERAQGLGESKKPVVETQNWHVPAGAHCMPVRSV